MLRAKEVPSFRPNPMERALKLKRHKPKYQAGSTLKFQALLEKRKRDEEIAEYKLKEERLAEEERLFRRQKVILD